VSKITGIKHRHESPFGRLPILGISPSVESGRWSAKAFAGEVIPFSTNVFREGHDSLGVELLLTDPKGSLSTHRMSPGSLGSDRWHTSVLIRDEGVYKFSIRAFGDDFETWHHNASIKIAVGIDEELMLLEGIALLTRAASEPARSKNNAMHLVELAEYLSDTDKPAKTRLAAAETAQIAKLMAEEPIRSLVTLSDEFLLEAERERAGVGAWYEFFPRSEGATFDEKTKVWKSGTFKTATKRLPAVAAMGFNVLYMPPIHPIGTAFRKGPNNSLQAGPQDPGSPWAIGSADGGHDAVAHESLNDFRHLHTSLLSKFFHS